MQAKCPKCDGTAFRMLPESQRVTEVECLNCGHVGPFVATVTDQSPKKEARLEAASGCE
jgi:Zn ribbon nucleic-acid-binding protein